MVDPAPVGIPIQNSNYIPSFSQFDPSVCRFSVYVQRFRQSLLLYNVPAAKHVPAFLTALGDAHFQLLTNLLAPTDPTTQTLDQLITTLKNYFEPATLEVAERQKFYKRRQGDGETIATFTSDLKRLSLSCNFGDHLNDALRDQFVSGIRSEATRKKLVSEANLTWERAFQVAQQQEAIDRELPLFHSSSAPSTVSAVRSKFPPKSGTFNRRGRPAPNSNWPPNSNSNSKPAQFRPPPNNSNSSRPKSGTCHRCGDSRHWAPQCPHIHTRCNKCGKTGHLAKVCHSTSNPRRPVNAVESVPEIAYVGAINSHSADRDEIMIAGHVSSIPIQMLLDTGAKVSIFTLDTWRKIGSPTIIPASIRLQSYGGTDLVVKGKIQVPLTVENFTTPVEVYVVGNYGANIFGRDLFSIYPLKWDEILRRLIRAPINVCSISLNDITKEFPKLFSSELGHIKDIRAHIELRPEASPKFCKPRPVPFAMKTKIEDDLDRLQRLGVIEPVLRSDWAAPIVPVQKPDGTVRICGDFRLTVNPAIQSDWYPLPTTEDLFASFADCQYFSKLDLADAYLQVELEEDAKKCIVINTHKGLFKYNRLPFGVSFAPGLFQHAIERLTSGLEGVSCYLDDLIVAAATKEEHDSRLRALLQRLEEKGARVKPSKCEIGCTSLKYLGHRIDSTGIHPLRDKIDAIVKAPIPDGPGKLQSFLGLVNYYGKFIPNFSTISAPLYRLLHQDSEWIWSKDCAKAFKELQSSLTSDSLLVHYNSKLPIGLACDASGVGIGAVLFHTMPDGSQRPIAFASKTLSSSEKLYSQIEREALGLIFGIGKFHRYLYGRRFELVTDHKPLLVVLGPKGHIQSVSASRLHRWSISMLMIPYSMICHSLLYFP